MPSSEKTKPFLPNSSVETPTYPPLFRATAETGIACLSLPSSVERMPAHWKPLMFLSINTFGGQAAAIERRGVGGGLAVSLAIGGVAAGTCWRADNSSPPPIRPNTSATETANANLARRIAGAGDASPRKLPAALASQARGQGRRVWVSGSSRRKLRRDGGADGRGPSTTLRRRSSRAFSFIALPPPADRWQATFAPIPRAAPAGRSGASTGPFRAVRRAGPRSAGARGRART